jgi:CMP-N-acetylneuraminic acid synthetase
MFKTNRVLVVVPARGGSKGITLKNLRPVGGVPLVARVGHMIAELDYVDRAVVSTDHEEIAKVAESAGLDAPFRRPADISGDRIGDWDVLAHALHEMETIDDTQYDVVVMLQPTSPGRTADQVTQTLTHLIDGGFDSVWSVSETDSKHHPLKQLVVADDGGLDHYDKRGADIVARQQLTPVYHRNGIAYAMTRDCIVQQRTIKGARAGAVIIEGPVVNIDTELDLDWAEFVTSKSDSV